MVRCSSVFCAMVVCAAFAVFAAPASAGLIDYWSFDSNGADSVGSITGTLTNGASINTTTKKLGGGALSLDGTDDYVQMNGKAINTSMGSFSTSIWFKTSMTGIGPLYWEGATGGKGVWLRMSAGYTTGLALGDTAQVTVSTATTKNNNAWHLFTLVGDNTSLKLYVDDGTTSYTTAATYGTGTTTANTLIGVRPAQDQFFSGAIDDVGVWNMALSSTYAAALYNVGNTLSLAYGANDAQTLFTAYEDPSHGVYTTSNGTQWQYATGLTGAAGSVVNGGTALVLGAGTGVQIVPEPGTLALLTTALLGLLAYAWRKRK